MIRENKIFAASVQGMVGLNPVGDVARRCQVPKGTLYNWLRGARPRDEAAFKRLCEYFSRAPEDLLDGVAWERSTRGRHVWKNIFD